MVEDNSKNLPPLRPPSSFTEPTFVKRLKEKVEASGSNIEKINQAFSDYLDETEQSINLKNPGSDFEEVSENDENVYLISQSIKNYELMKIKEQQNINKSLVKEVDLDLNNEIERIFYQLKKHQNSRPEKLLSVALAGANSLEQKRFLLVNLLESLKKGDNYYSVLKRFNQLGITDIELPSAKVIKADKIKGKGSGIVASIKSIGKFSFALYQVIANTIKAIPSFVKLKPRVGFTGPVPSMSFEIEGAGVTIQRLWELLTENA